MSSLLLPRGRISNTLIHTPVQTTPGQESPKESASTFLGMNLEQETPSSPWRQTPASLSSLMAPSLSSRTAVGTQWIPAGRKGKTAGLGFIHSGTELGLQQICYNTYSGALSSVFESHILTTTSAICIWNKHPQKEFYAGWSLRTISQAFFPNAWYIHLHPWWTKQLLKECCFLLVSNFFFFHHFTFLKFIFVPWIRELKLAASNFSLAS